MKHSLLCLLLLTAPFVSSGQTESAYAKKAFAFLKSAQDSTGQFRDSLNPLFNVWETILVTDALLGKLPEDDPVIQRAITWLKTNENERGLICHNDACREKYCVETSSLYLQLLFRTRGHDIIDPVITLSQMQEENGSWKIGNPDVSSQVDFPSVTAFAVNLFLLTRYDDWNEQTAIGYLSARQLPDGSFGKTWEYYNCTGYALWQCMPVLKQYPQTGAYKKAKAFILSQQLPDGSWNDPEQTVNHVSAELQTVFMLHCLKDETDPPSVEAYRKGLTFLLEKQLPGGAWDGGYFPVPNERYKKREYLITTALAYKLLVSAPKNE